MTPITIDFVPEPEIWKAAEAKLEELGYVDDLPIPIEFILEDMGLDIVPVPSLRSSSCIDGFTTADLTEIRVDQDVYGSCEVRLRFTLAHELGHITLHPFLFSERHFSSVEEWKNFIKTGITSKEYGYLEYQANAFAGYFLVPRAHLQKNFDTVLPEIDSMINTAKEKGIGRDMYLASAVSQMARRLRPVFDVSEEVLERRITKDKLDELIP